MLILTEKISLLEKHLGAFFYGWAFELEELSLNVSAQGITEALGLLKAHEDLLYAQLLDICAVDYLGRKPVRFEVVYHLLSLVYNERIRVKVSVGENDKVPSVTSLFPGADWWESEAYDMFGIIFEGHPGLRRILTDYDFEGFPLRKDFPLTGYTEVRYDPVQQKVISEPVKLAQAYRSFETLSPWQGVSDVLKREGT